MNWQCVTVLALAPFTDITVTGCTLHNTILLVLLFTAILPVHPQWRRRYNCVCYGRGWWHRICLRRGWVASLHVSL